MALVDKGVQGEEVAPVEGALGPLVSQKLAGTCMGVETARSSLVARRQSNVDTGYVCVCVCVCVCVSACRA